MSDALSGGHTLTWVGIALCIVQAGIFRALDRGAQHFAGRLDFQHRLRSVVKALNATAEGAAATSPSAARLPGLMLIVAA